MRRFLIWIFIAFTTIASGQNPVLQSGPMLGPVTLRDCSIWFQTKAEATVQIAYNMVDGNKEENFSSKMVTQSEKAFTGTIHLTNLYPGTKYEYHILVDGKRVSTTAPFVFTTQEHWQFRNDPPDFSFAAGSCMYINDATYDRPGKPYGGEYEILNHIVASQPQFMVWLGDNIYLREGDYESRSGIYYRNTHTRSLKELQPLLSATHHYAIWDDHDYGTNDADWTYPLKQHSLDAFTDFWPSESYGAGHTEGITNSFVWNDCQFFMLDNRWYKTVQREDGTILGDQQKYWFKEALLASKAAYKFVAVGGQFLSDFAGFENFANYKEEREEIIQFIEENDIKNVVFLTGDRHHSEISKMVTKSGNVIYDVTSSAITSTTYDHSQEQNTFRVPGSMISVRNIAIFSIDGKKNERKLHVVFKNTLGEEVYKYNFE